MLLFEIINILLIVVRVDERRLVCACHCVCVCVCVVSIGDNGNLSKVLFAEMYVNVCVFCNKMFVQRSEFNSG